MSKSAIVLLLSGVNCSSPTVKAMSSVSLLKVGGVNEVPLSKSSQTSF